MPYPPGHKQKTRTRILRSAVRLFVARGYQGTTIDQVMDACGLTRGAFYAHFRSKAHLYEEAMRMAPEHRSPADPRLAQHWTGELLDPLAASATRESALSGEWGFLAADAASESAEVRSSYEESIRQLLRKASGPVPPDHLLLHDNALAAVAMAVGCLVICCSVDGQPLRDAVLRACRKVLESDSENDVSHSEDLLWDA